jgi:hypothetical protein
MPYYFKIRFNIILSPTPVSQVVPSLQIFRLKSCIYFHIPPFMLNTRPVHQPWCDYPNNVWWNTQFMKLLYTVFSVLFVISPLLGPWLSSRTSPVCVCVCVWERERSGSTSIWSIHAVCWVNTTLCVCLFDRYPCPTPEMSPYWTCRGNSPAFISARCLQTPLCFTQKSNLLLWPSSVSNNFLFTFGACHRCWCLWIWFCDVSFSYCANTLNTLSTATDNIVVVFEGIGLLACSGSEFISWNL